jgi:hypothetical protein
MMFERGDLLLVPFPFTDLSAAKRRPVLAVARMERSAIPGPPSWDSRVSLRSTRATKS